MISALASLLHSYYTAKYWLKRYCFFKYANTSSLIKVVQHKVYLVIEWLAPNWYTKVCVVADLSWKAICLFKQMLCNALNTKLYWPKTYQHTPTPVYILWFAKVLQSKTLFSRYMYIFLLICIRRFCYIFCFYEACDLY